MGLLNIDWTNQFCVPVQRKLPAKVPPTLRNDLLPSLQITLNMNLTLAAILFVFFSNASYLLSSHPNCWLNVGLRDHNVELGWRGIPNTKQEWGWRLLKYRIDGWMDEWMLDWWKHTHDSEVLVVSAVQPQSGHLLSHDKLRYAKPPSVDGGAASTDISLPLSLSHSLPHFLWVYQCGMEKRVCKKK